MSYRPKPPPTLLDINELNNQLIDPHAFSSCPSITTSSSFHSHLCSFNSSLTHNSSFFVLTPPPSHTSHSTPPVDSWLRAAVVNKVCLCTG